jgi:hypothetical protein
MKALVIFLALGLSASGMAAGMPREKAVPFLENRFAVAAVVMRAEVKRTYYGYRIVPREIWKSPADALAPVLGKEINVPLSPDAAAGVAPKEAVVCFSDPTRPAAFSLLAFGPAGDLLLCPELDRAALKAIAQSAK